MENEIYWSLKNIETTLSVKKSYITTIEDSIVISFDVGLYLEIPILDIFSLRSNYIRRSKKIPEKSRETEWYGFGLKFEPSSTIFLDLWIGKEKGALTCSGGVCRELVPFDGFKVLLNMTL